MSFDKDEASLDVLYNTWKVKEQQIKWNQEEIKLHNSIIAAQDDKIKNLGNKITGLETRIFFAQIDRYNDYLMFHELDELLDKEFQELNHD
jgi:hypothetical protein